MQRWTPHFMHFIRTYEWQSLHLCFGSEWAGQCPTLSHRATLPAHIRSDIFFGRCRLWWSHLTDCRWWPATSSSQCWWKFVLLYQRLTNTSCQLDRSICSRVGNISCVACRLYTNQPLTTARFKVQRNILLYHFVLLWGNLVQRHQRIKQVYTAHVFVILFHNCRTINIDIHVLFTIPSDDLLTFDIGCSSLWVDDDRTAEFWWPVTLVSWHMHQTHLYQNAKILFNFCQISANIGCRLNDLDICLLYYVLQ